MQDIWVIVFLLAGIVGFGFYALPLKWYHITDISPPILQIYFAISIFITNFILLPFVNFQFTYHGVIGGVIWSITSMLSFPAIKYAGIAVAQGTWSGVIILVSFLWGAVYFEEPIRNMKLVIVSLVFIFCGVIMICTSDTQIHLPLPQNLQWLYNLNWIFKPEEHPDAIEEMSEEVEFRRLSQLVIQATPMIPNSHVSQNRLNLLQLKESVSDHRLYLGILISILLGTIAGCMYVPLKFLPPEFEGEGRIVFVYSFGIGVLVFSLIVLSIFLLYKSIRGEPIMSLFTLKDIGAGGLSGVIWGLSNICSTMAIIYLGIAVAFPLTQSNIIIAGLVGIFILKEITRTAAIVQLVSGGVVLVGGCVFLAHFS